MSHELYISAELLPLLKGKTLYCGFSGGPDSLALLLLAIHCAGTGEFAVRAVHFEHGFRGQDSLDDAAFCRNFCVEYGVPLQVIPLSVPEHRLPGEGDEAAARRLRLTAWQTLLAGQGDAIVALGHHADDRVENLLLRLARGSNASALTSMRAVQRIGPVLFVRPLLNFTREEILASLNGLPFRTDSTNSEFRYARNFLRRRILPEWYEKMPFARAGLRQAVKVLEQDATALEQLSDSAFAEIAGRRRTMYSFWLRLHPAIRVRVLRRWLDEHFHAGFVPDSEWVDRFGGLLNDAESAEPRLLELSDAACVVFQQDQVTFLPAAPAETDWRYTLDHELFYADYQITAGQVSRVEVRPDAGPDTVYFDADLLPDVLTVAPARPGESMIPFGADSPKPLKKIYSDARIGLAERRMLPVLRTESGMALWLPGVRRSAVAPLTAHTTRIVCFTFRAAN